MAMQEDGLNEKYVYFVTGGGTGGHIYPAIAIAKELLKESGTKKVYFVGNPKKPEYEIATKAGFDFLPVNISGMPRKFGVNLIKWLFQLEFASWKALYYIWKYKPNAVFGTGGYVSAPALFACTISNTPFMIHDCDVNPGMVSRFISSSAKSISIAFDEAKEYFKSPTVNADIIHYNGNPVESKFFEHSKEDSLNLLGLQNKLTILTMGGSQGASTINNAIISISGKLIDKFDVQLVIQTGVKNYDASLALLNEVYPSYAEDRRVLIKPYFEDMSIPLSACDVAISRAGSMSLSEICASQAASILVPYPYASSDHQRKNAHAMHNAKASLYLEDSDCNEINLFSALSELIDNPEKIEEMKNNAKTLSKPNAVQNIVQQLKGIIRK